MDIEYHKGILFVRLNGVLNKKSSYKINNYVIPIIKKHNIKYLMYNFNKLQNIEDNGIDAIINSKCIIKRNYGKIFVCKMNDIVKNKLKKVRCKVVNEEKEIFYMIGA